MAVQGLLYGLEGGTVSGAGILFSLEGVAGQENAGILYGLEGGNNQSVAGQLFGLEGGTAGLSVHAGDPIGTFEPGDTVYLEAFGDLTGATLIWSQVSGAEVELFSNNQYTRFVVPRVLTVQSLVFRITAEHPDYATVSDDVAVSINNYSGFWTSSPGGVRKALSIDWSVYA